MNLENPTLIKELQKIIRAAGREILEVYQQKEFGIDSKADKSPITIADERAHQKIIQGLASLNEVIPVISEEHRNRPYEERKDEEWQWMVDPLDGTKEFIKRNDEFTVNIALLHFQTPVLGMVYVPVQDKLYYGIHDKGSYLVAGDSETALQANSFDWNDEGLKVLCSRSHLNEATVEFLDQLNEPQTVSAGSSLKFLLIAEGKADIYPRLAPTMEWDTAAAHIILQEAGGKVLQYESREPLIYNKKELKNPFFLAFGQGDIPDKL